GLTRDETQLADHHAVLGLLERLTEPPVIILARYVNFAYAGFNDPHVNSFLNHHADGFGVEPPTCGSTAEESSLCTLYEHYVNDLVQLNLLRDTEGVAKSSPIQSVAATPMGRMVLGAIDRASQAERLRMRHSPMPLVRIPAAFDHPDWLFEL